MNRLSSKQKLARQQATEWVIKLNSDTPDKDAFNAWLSRSPDNSIAYLRAEWLWANSSQLHLRAPMEGAQALELTSNFSSKLNRLLAQYKMMGAICACLLIISMVSLGLLKPNTSITQSDLFITAYGEVKTYNLVDGSTLTLNANSKVQVNIDSTERAISLISGEAFFKVKSMKSLPFLVKSNGVNVRVLGTQFSVKSTSSEESVTVLEGKVSVSPSVQSDHPPLTLTQNEAVSIEKKSTVIKPIKVNAKEKLAWTNKKLVYKGEKLASVISDLNQYYDTKFKLADSNLNDTKVIAVISLNSQESTLEKLQSLLKLEAHYDKDKNIIYLNKK